MSYHGVILAAGKGERFGAKKHFFKLHDKPLIYFSLLAFERSMVKEVIIVTNGEDIERMEKIVKKERFEKVKKILRGGKTRQESSRIGIYAISANEGFVAIHDAARPFITSDDVNIGFKHVREKKAVIYGFPVVDTIKKVKKGKIEETLERENLYLALTPQFFEISLIKEAHKIAEKKGYIGTDDASLCENAGFDVFVIKGKRRNIKITFKEDIEFLKVLL